MAKGDAKVEHVRSKKPRTAAQQARDNLRKQQNMEMAARRLERLQAEQRAANQAKAEQQAKEIRLAAESAFVQAALNGPHASHIRRWLAMRIPTFERLDRFFKERPHLTAPDTFVRRAA